MKDIIKKVPVPICGVMLGAAALGNLLQSYSEGVRYVCGIFSAFMLVLMILKMIMCSDSFKEDMKNPIMASVFATFPMALMLLSTYVKPFIGQAASVIWYFAIGLHLVIIVYFTLSFIFKLQMPKVFASYFIVYVGIAVAGITAPAFGQLGIGSASFWFGLVCYVALMVLVTYRYLKFKEIPDPAKPLICIYAAPTSLLIAAYVQSVTPKNLSFLLCLLAIAQLLYIFGLFKAVGYLKLPFFPSYASFTFPFVISAIAAKQTMACAAKLGSPMPWLSTVVNVETIIAAIFVVYVFARFMAAIFGSKK